MIPVLALAQPITQLIQAVGTGVLGHGSPDSLLKAASQGLSASMELGIDAATELESLWQSQAARAAQQKISDAHVSGHKLAERGHSIARIVQVAAADVHRGTLELEGILESFVAIATAVGPALMTPPGQAVLITAAIEHIEQAMAVVARMRGELSVHTAQMVPLIDKVPVPPPPNPQGLARMAMQTFSSVGDSAQQLVGGRDPSSTSAAGFVPADPSAAGTALAGMGGAPGAGPAGTGASGAPGVAGMFGGAGSTGSGSAQPGGVAVRLPDGKVVMAPNERAASAVRNALSQRGTPYAWGGENPGKGMDCSGLTQWAYGKSGVDLPRLAQQQDVGEQIPQSRIEPGDLAVWDGHVAMCIGDGKMVEAGDPVEVSAVRTTNLGMGFKGFYRPTE